MDKLDINSIIASELVVRKNNARIRQEYGKYQENSNVLVVNGFTEFTTEYKIVNIVYVTVDGVVQAPGKDYNTVGGRTIRFEQDPGSRSNPPFIQVGYAFDKSAEFGAVRPFISLFTSAPSTGLDGIITFALEIVNPGNYAENIYWSIMRDGDAANIIASGEALSSTSIPAITDTITQSDVSYRQGETVPYTLIVVYDMAASANTAPELNEKLMATTTYDISEVVPLIGEIKVTPSVVTVAGAGVYEVDYSVIQAANSVNAFNWKLVRTKAGIDTVVASGNEASEAVNNTVRLPGGFGYTAEAGKPTTEKFSLQVDAYRAGAYKQVMTSVFKTAVPAVVVNGRIGTMPDSIYNLHGTPANVDSSTYLSRIAGEPNIWLGGNNSISQNAIDVKAPLPVIAHTDYITETQYVVIEVPISMSNDNAGGFDLMEEAFVMSSSEYTKFVIADYVVFIISKAPYVPTMLPVMKVIQK